MKNYCTLIALHGSNTVGQSKFIYVDANIYLAFMRFEKRDLKSISTL